MIKLKKRKPTVDKNDGKNGVKREHYKKLFYTKPRCKENLTQKKLLGGV